MADYQNLSAPELNQINGSSSALGEGTFKRRDELRRAESVQRNRVRMSERLDRNITRAVRKGDANSARAFNALKESITGQGYMGGGGIVNAEDQQDRVKDGAIKAADTRYNMGNIGNTNPADGPIANAPPPVEKPQGGGSPFNDSNWNSQSSIQNPVAGPQTAPEAAPAPSASPSATSQPQGSIADVSAKRSAVAKLTSKFKKESIDPVAIQTAYQAEMGDPADQAFNTPPLEAAPKKTASPKQTRVPSADDIAFGERVGNAAGKVKEGVDSLGKKIDGSLDDAAARRSTYEKNEAERLRKRNEGMAAIDSKLKSEITRADQAHAVQKSIRADYEKDYKAVERRNRQHVKDLNGYDPIAKAGAGLFGEMEQWPEMPAPINYDTFDPANPPKYQRQLSPKAPPKVAPGKYAGYSPNDMSQAAIMYRQSQAQAALKTYTQPPSNPPPR